VNNTALQNNITIVSSSIKTVTTYAVMLPDAANQSLEHFLLDVKNTNGEIKRKTTGNACYNHCSTTVINLSASQHIRDQVTQNNKFTNCRL
jgi:hypothetical protein